MAQHGFNPLAGGHGGGGSIDPNDLTMPGTFSSSYQNNFNNSSNQSNSYSTGSALFGDDELLDGLGSPTDAQSGLHGGGQDFGAMNEMTMSGYTNSIYATHHGLPMDQNRINGYSNTPEGDPIQSPFAHNFGQYRQMHHPQSFGNSLQSPISYAGSPLAGSDLNQDGADPNYLNTKVRPRMPTAMARKTSTTRSPLTPKASAAMANLTIGSADSFNTQPIRTNGATHHEKAHSGQWIQTPNSMGSYPGSGFSSPIQPGLHNAQINDILLKGGTSMPAKLGAPLTSSQEAKRKRRRESHNLVERRRRDNINERIQDLSKLVPSHRLEDEKIKKLIQNGTPLSPSLAGISSPSQATSGLAGPGARRAAGGSAGNITTGLPIDDKDKGPNKGDILNGAVSWTRDLMWMLHLKLQQQEELANYIMDLGGQFPFEPTDDEKRMQTELVEAMARNEGLEDSKPFVYSRRAGSGLRVPHHTDYKGEPLDGSGRAAADAATSASPSDPVNNPNLGSDLVDQNQFWNDEDDGSGELDFKEEDEYMDLN